MTRPTAASPPRSLRPRDLAELPAGTKLPLVEFLLENEDLVQCAVRSLEWLGAQAGVEQALCATIDADRTRLIGLAGYGLAAVAVDQFWIDLEAGDHPLVRALSQTEPIVVRKGGNDSGRYSLPPFRRATLLAVPLLGAIDGQQATAGLLLLTPASPGIARQVGWLAEILGHQLVRLRGIRRLTRERSVLNSITNLVPDPILQTDAEGRLVVANQRAEALFGSREDESEGRRRAVALNNMLFSAALGETAVRGGQPERRELLLVDPADGSDLLFELLSTVAGDPREGTGIVSILRNVTDLRRATQELEENYRRLHLAEAKVRAERDRLNLIIDSVADPVVVTDPTGNVALMNTPAERLFTLPPGASATEIQRVRANDAHFTSHVSNLLFGTADLRYEGSVSLVDAKTGAVIPMEALSGQILSETGVFIGVVTILHDRTEALEKERLVEELQHARDELTEKVREATAELVRQNELLRRQAIELEHASALKSQFLANVSHEFRTPLNAILGYTSLLLQGVSGDLTLLQKENLSRVDSNARHLVAIIDEILDIARIEANKMPVRLSTFGVDNLIAEVVAELEPLIVRSRLAVRSDVPNRLPPVRSDRQKIKQIVLNFLSNAIKFTPQGSVTVSATLQEPAKAIAIAVADTGIGIARADREKVFEDFRQADDSPARLYGGTGLGLSISRRLATMLRAEITLESELGKGSTFSLILPVKWRRR